MHSMVGAFSPYAVKRHRAEIVRGYCYRFFQCSFPCGIVMLILSILFILAGASQLIYIFHYNGCNPTVTATSESSSDNDFSIATSLSSSATFKCNRNTMKVLGITFVVIGSVLLLISLLITKYSRSGEENNVIRATTSSLLANNTKTNQNQQPAPPPPPHHHPSSYYQHSPSSSTHDQNHIIVSVK